MDASTFILELQKLSQLATSRARRITFTNHMVKDKQILEDRIAVIKWNDDLKKHINHIIHYIQYYDECKSEPDV